MPIPTPPTVARIVHYHYPERGLTRPYAAIISGVGVGGLVDLNVFVNNGDSPEVKLGVPCSMSGEPQPGHWNWPPRDNITFA